MKFVALAVVATLGTTTAFFKGKLPFTNTPKPAETTQVTLTSASVTGNIVDARLNSNQAQSNTNLSKNVSKINVDPSRVLYLGTEVTYPSVQFLVDEIKKLNAQSAEDIFLLIDSPGGSVLDGATLESEIESSKAHVNTVCTRLCASMAAMIHSYGYKRYMTDRAILMFHPASGGAQGQVPNMLSQLTTITRYLDKQVANVTSRSKVSKAEYDQLVSYELWIDSEDSVAKGLADGIVNLSVSNHPGKQQELPPPEQQKTPRTNTQPFTFNYVSPYKNLWDRK